ncbi:SDR family NAD(P)-dependent oxidoreductase [Rhizobium sp. L9]|uniref:SDR family NAD(P)-dependent oxidoreductase n=1 Tax=Rhizobium sp. L9 TaxID=1340738 RepID=UPI001FE22D76|nr:SDR family NAD(P)-dependent oxidoreductase [Rhizobium sp. L9]
MARDQNSLIETKASIEALGRTCITGAQDVTNISSIDETLSKFENIAGAVDILVNNAGYEQVSPSLEIDEQIGTRSSAPTLRARFSGRKAQRGGCQGSAFSYA